MFAAFDHATGMPRLETRKALIIINLQNDSFYTTDDFYITKNPEFIPRLRELIPYFRKVGDVIWVRTELAALPSSSFSEADSAFLESKSATLAEQNRKDRQKEEASLHDDTKDQKRSKSSRQAKTDAERRNDLPTSHPSSRARESLTRASAETRANKRTADLHEFHDHGNPSEEQMSKPRKGHQARFYIQGTRGADICDELKESADQERDGIVIKHSYSAFDQTSLLMSLRMNLVTEIYLCGCLTNAGVYSTAADAVQHGLQVTLIQDCLGYRDGSKHDEAIRQMADIMGITGITSEDFIIESGGRDIPDAETPGITLQELSIATNQSRDQAALVAAGVESGMPTHGGHQTNPKSITSMTRGSAPSAMTSPRIRHKPSRSNNQLTAAAAAILAEESAAQAKPSTSTSRKRSSANKGMAAILEPKDVIGSGDCRILLNVFKSSIVVLGFKQLKDEVEWQTMLHRSGQVPRLVAVQGEIGKDGSVPIYRHPADESPPLLAFTPTVWQIRREVEKVLGQPFNHALIQLYRNGDDNISEHSDKTLDIVRGSSIANVSFGAQRFMTLRTKRSKNAQASETSGSRQSQRIKMPHNSIFVLGPNTNREWLHGVRADKRPPQERTDEEKAYNGERISITFRQIGTFMNVKQNAIWGTGALNKLKAAPGRISRNDAAQTSAMIAAFGLENQQKDFDWAVEYGQGFNVISLVESPKTEDRPAQLTLCDDPVANLRVQLALNDKCIPFNILAGQRGHPAQPNEVLASSIPPPSRPHRFVPWTHSLSNTENPLLKGIKPDRAAILEGDLAILFHLEKHYMDASTSEDGDRATTASEKSSGEGYSTAQLFSAAAQANELLYIWREYRDQAAHSHHHRQHHGGHKTKDEEEDEDDGYASSDGNSSFGANSPPTHRYNLEPPTPAPTEQSLHDELHEALAQWEGYLEGEEYLAGGSGCTVMDYAFWPVLDEVLRGLGVAGGFGMGIRGVGEDSGEDDDDDDQGKSEVEYEEGLERWPNLTRYHRRINGREGVWDILTAVRGGDGEGED